MGVSKKIELSKIQYNHVVMIIGFVPIITIFYNKIIKLLLHCFALFNTNVQFCAL